MFNDGSGEQGRRVLIVGIAASVVLHLVCLLLFPYWGGTTVRSSTSPTLIVSIIETPLSPDRSVPVAKAPPTRAPLPGPSSKAPKAPKAPEAQQEPSSGHGKSNMPPSTIDSSMPTQRSRIPLADWRRSVAEAIRPSDNLTSVDPAERAVRGQSITAGRGEIERNERVSNPVALAFEAALGAGWQSAAVASSETRPDGSRVERVQTPNGTYCVRIPSQVTSIDPFVKRERPLIAVKC